MHDRRARIEGWDASGSAPSPPSTSAPSPQTTRPTTAPPQHLSGSATAAPPARISFPVSGRAIDNAIDTWKSLHPRCDDELDADGRDLERACLALCTEAINRAATCRSDAAFTAVFDRDAEKKRLVGTLDDRLGDARAVTRTCSIFASNQFCRSPWWQQADRAPALERMLAGDCGDVARRLMPMLLPGE